MNSSIQLSLFLGLVLFVSSGLAIKCYVCNSLKDQGCTSSKPPSSSYLKDCNELFGGDKATVCRKIDQSVPSQDGLPAEGNFRTIRECGQDDPAAETCYTKAGFGGKQYVCSCTKDSCNGSSNLQVALTSLFSFVVLALIGPKFLL